MVNRESEKVRIHTCLPSAHLWIWSFLSELLTGGLFDSFLWNTNYFDETRQSVLQNTSVVSRQVFGGTGQIETRFKKPRRVETGSETTQN